MYKKNIILCVLMIIITGSTFTFGNPVIDAVIDNDLYEVGDLVTLKVNLSNNPAIRGIYFDLAFDGSVLVFEGLSKGFAVLQEPVANEFYYVVSDPLTSTTHGSRVIISYALVPDNVTTLATGCIAELRFRVKAAGVGGAHYSFEFANTQVYDGDGSSISQAEFNTSQQFQIGSTIIPGFITITNPLGNTVVYKNSIKLSAICSQENGNTIVIKNSSINWQSASINASSGSIVDIDVPVGYNGNYINATLYNATGAFIATDILYIYRASDENVIEIVSPLDHSLLNTDLIYVKVASKLAGVIVNNVIADKTNEIHEGRTLYKSKAVWLKSGFNKINASVTSPENNIYSTSILVYYQKDESVFRIVTPYSGQVYKSSVNTFLEISGEIGGTINNSVSVDVIYHPRNTFEDSRYLVKDATAIIKETEFLPGESRVPYMFRLVDKIPLDNEGSGEIEVIAYKNKSGKNWDDEIHRFCTVYNGSLRIDLVQPHIYGNDTLDTESKLEEFKGQTTPNFQGMTLSDNGEYLLENASVKKARQVVPFSGKIASDIIETPSHDVYALVNGNNLMKIYKRTFGSSTWDAIISKNDMYGYCLAYSERGVFVGVSNIYANDNSGLYIVEGTELRNVTIGEPIPYVQFIQNRNGLVYIYGNDYSHIYAFQAYSLEYDAQTQNYSGSIAKKIPFSNNIFINEFVLSDDCHTAAIVSTSGRVMFYQQTEGIGFTAVPFNEKQIPSTDSFERIVYGINSEGMYSTYLLKKKGGGYLTVMENKADHRLVVNPLRIEVLEGRALVGICYSGDNFCFAYEDGNLYKILKGRIMFGSFVQAAEDVESYSIDPGVVISNGNLRMLPSKNYEYFIGFGSGLSDKNTYQLYSDYPISGTAVFAYSNEDADGLYGFSFEVDPVWLSSDECLFGFQYLDENGAIKINQAPLSLRSLMEYTVNTVPDNSYSVTTEYNYVINKMVLRIDFNAFNKKGIVWFDLSMQKAGENTPVFSNLTVYKKVPVRIPKAEQGITYIPIHGFIEDPTVSEVKVEETILTLERDGSFSYSYPLYTTNSEKTISIECRNRFGEHASLSFRAILTDSLNGVSATTFKDSVGSELSFDSMIPNLLRVSGESVLIDGEYFGLEGVVVGYEIYRYINDEAGSEQLVLAKSDVFEKNAVPPGTGGYGAGYESGSFSDQSIDIFPGKQRLVVYAENPGGKRTEYKIGSSYPDIIYDLPESEQEIKLSNSDISTIIDPAGITHIESIKFDKLLTLSVPEVSRADGAYAYSESYIIRGEIRSLNDFKELKVRSYSSAVTFPGGVSETVVQVGVNNTFNLRIDVLMPEKCISETYSVAFIPTAPFLDWMSRGLTIVANKDFRKAHIIPDFSLVDPSEKPWSEDEVANKEKSLRIVFDRFVPEGTALTIKVNDSIPVTGNLEVISKEAGIYKAISGVGKELMFGGIRTGINRIAWSLGYNGDVINSSSLPGMEDYIFNYAGVIESTPTIISFNIEPQTYYSDETESRLPDFTVSKDVRTTVELKCNDQVKWTNGKNEKGITIDWTLDSNKALLKEGKNIFVFTYKEVEKATKILEYVFFYDTQNPEVSIASYAYDENYELLVSITAIVKEANLDTVSLIQVDTNNQSAAATIQRIPSITFLVNDQYKVQWDNLNDPVLGMQVISTLYPVNVLAEDKAGHSGNSGTFYGISQTVVRPNEKYPVFLNNLPIVIPYYNPATGSPLFMNEANFDNEPFPEHIKFYRDELNMHSITVNPDTNLKIQSAVDLVLGSDLSNIEATKVTVSPGSDQETDLSLSANNSITLNPGFVVESGATLKLSTTTNYNTVSSLDFTHDEASVSTSFGFWFRFEHESYYATDNDFRKVLTIYEQNDADGGSLFLAYKDPDNSVSGDEYLVLCKSYLEEIDGIFVEQISEMSGSHAVLSTSGYEGWHLVIFTVNQASNAVKIAVDEYQPVNYSISEPYSEFMPAILLANAHYYFGNKASAKNGYFSIAHPFYINGEVSPNEIVDFTELQSGSGPQMNVSEFQRKFDFNFNGDSAGSLYHQLRYVGTSEYTEKENADFRIANSGSLRSTNNHKNYLTTSSEGIVIFDGASSPMTYNLGITHDTDTFTLSPLNDGYKGKYYFGNNPEANYGIASNKNYSFSGRVENLEQDTVVRLVVRINGVEQGMSLAKGDFHFVYKKNQSELVKNILAYIETDGEITFSNSMVFNEGNYPIPFEGLHQFDKSGATTMFIFNTEGTIDFWYKPFNTNVYGFVNYPVVLFDSEFVTIGTSTADESGNACFYAHIKNPEGGISDSSIDTRIPVQEGWQHIQFSYSINEPNSLAYLYINGKMAGLSEAEEIPQSQSMNGTPLVDNVFIGMDAAHTVFAEGFIDEVLLSHFYQDPMFESKKPYDFTYSDTPSSALAINLLNGLSSGMISSPEFVCISKNGSTRIFNRPISVADADDHGIVASTLNPGAYTVYSKMTINGHNYSGIFSFLKNDRPAINVSCLTPLIENDKDTDIEFLIEYDDSYILGNSEAKYAGVAIETSWDQGSQKIKNTVYITQDFLTNNVQDWIKGDGMLDAWAGASNDSNLFHVTIPDINSSGPVAWKAIPFYFTSFYDTGSPRSDIFPFEKLLERYPQTATNTICDISFTVEKIPLTFGDMNGQPDGNINYEYKLAVQVGSSASSFREDIIDNLSVDCKVKITEVDEILHPGVNIDTMPDKTTEVSLNNFGYCELYYDDILPKFGGSINAYYGTYNCTMSLDYKDTIYKSESLTLNWEKKQLVLKDVQQKELSIVDFAILSIDKSANKSSLYLEFKQNGLTENLECSIKVFKINGKEGSAFYTIDHYPLSKTVLQNIISDIRVPEGDFEINVTLSANAEVPSKSATISGSNTRDVPEVVLTNTVDNLIAYNDVFFSWRGFLAGKFNPEILYRYIFDDHGWSPPSDTMSINFYKLEEGRHSFKVKAIFKPQTPGSDYIESVVESVYFTVDTRKPAINGDKLVTRDILDSCGLRSGLGIAGRADAVKDTTLSSFTIDGNSVPVATDGSFHEVILALRNDGNNRIVLSAGDGVNNFTDFIMNIVNPITELVYPLGTEPVVFAPVTVVGKLNSSIGVNAEIYLCDPLCSENGKSDYSGYKKARINEDRTFFIENVYINPGSSSLEANTPLKLITRFPSGTEFVKEFELYAREMLRPIDMVFNTHAVEGVTSGVEITIDCEARIPNISSWSIDFTGDGIYDLVDVIDDPGSGNTHKFRNVYSSIGLVTPRVRVITLDGRYFSVSDQLIIHEEITQASNKVIDKPIAMSVIKAQSGAHMLYVLSGSGTGLKIEVYEIGRNETFISDLLKTIKLSGSGISEPQFIKALDEKTIFVGENRYGRGYVFTLKANDFDNFIVQKEKVTFNATIVDLDADKVSVYVTLKDSNTVTKIPHSGGITSEADKVVLTPVTGNEDVPGMNLMIAKDATGILLSDYNKQRIISCTDSLQATDYFGSHGNGEGEFVFPSCIETFEDRILVYDKGRYDIQVFDSRFKLMTNIVYDAAHGADYLEPDFLHDLAGMGIMTKEEGSRLYYYAILLSKSKSKLSVLRLPQWEELRAKVRNNTIVFLKDREVFTAKPAGSDLRRIISSDSIPRIEGNLDYPALSPDGRTLVFTSRVRLYDGKTDSGTPDTDIYAYDNLYMYDLDNTGSLTRIPFGTLDHYEIERPVFNVNGDKIVFSAKPKGGKWQIYIYNTETGGISLLADIEGNARFPYYSPDDRFIVFTTDYDGDEEVEVLEVANPSVRISVTKNICRDSLPVWNTIYYGEVAGNKPDIKSKIAFVSERIYHKGVHYVYVSHPAENEIFICDRDGNPDNGNPDSIAMEITELNAEGDYPAFTGDGKSVVYENFDGKTYVLYRYDFDNTNPLERRKLINLPKGSRKPAGMKNRITGFTVLTDNGDEAKLSWNRYTDKDIFYTVKYRINTSSSKYIEKRIYSQNGVSINGLEMGTEYVFQVLIVENGEIAAESQIEKVKLDKVAARASYTIDPVNPYLVRFKAWTPDTTVQNLWKFTWTIDNVPHEMGSNKDFIFEFGTSGAKTVVLTVYDDTRTVAKTTTINLNIISDIHPVIEYNLSDDGSYIDVNAGNSKGQRIDWSSVQWVVSGPGRQPTLPVTGKQSIIDLTNFSKKINVNMRLSRIQVTGQQTDTLEENIIVDLDYKDVKPVISSEPDNGNALLYHFSGQNSFGNIDWTRAIWTIISDGVEIKREIGVSSLAYLFPETARKSSYVVSLTVPKRSDNMTATTSMIISLDALPVKPVIDYEVILMKEGTNVKGAKLILSCDKSLGSSIDYNQARWVVPVAGNYGEQSMQIGPTASYTLSGIAKDLYIDVSLTLMKRGGTDPVTETIRLKIDDKEIPATELVVKTVEEDSPTGKTVIFDALSSKGPNIDWENTEWLFDGQYPHKGPLARYDVPASGEKSILNWVCTMRLAGGTPIVRRGEHLIGISKIKPQITPVRKPGYPKNVYLLSALDTQGANIDWDRTMWFIYDGNENVIQKQGPEVMHTFAFKDGAMGYPVSVQMYLKGSSKPFVGYASINVEGDELLPAISVEADASNPNLMHFTASASSGSNIDWSNCKWTFGDSSEAQYGLTAIHIYVVQGTGETYKASLTITRRSANGTTEAKTAYKEISIGVDKITPVINARYMGGSAPYILLSSEDSTGNGLILDRSMWMFYGAGENETYQTQLGAGASVKTGFDLKTSVDPTGTFSAYFGMEAHASADTGYTSTTSLSNMHTGIVCTRYLNVFEQLIPPDLKVTLAIVRQNQEGNVEVKMITRTISVKQLQNSGTLTFK